MDEMTLTLNSPITEEQWDMIEDIDFDHTDSITFHTKHGKEVEFVKRKTGKWIPVDSYSAFGGDVVMWEIHGNPIAFYYCSECKEHAYAGEDGESLLTTYCPHCGARLVQEGEGHDKG